MASNRITVNLSESAYAALQELVKARDSTMTEVLKHAIGTEKFLMEEIKKGNKVLLEDEKGKMRQVIMR